MVPFVTTWSALMGEADAVSTLRQTSSTILLVSSSRYSLMSSPFKSSSTYSSLLGGTFLSLMLSSDVCF
jgi:hypothetical protein